MRVRVSTMRASTMRVQLCASTGRHTIETAGVTQGGG